MDSKVHNPGANVPAQTDEDPKGDRGQGDKTWAVPADEQGISNRPGDESESIDGDTAQQRSLGRDEVIEDNTENEENRNVQKDVQQAPEGRTRRRVQPDKKDKGSDADIKRHEYGIPEDASREGAASEHEGHGAPQRIK